MVGDRAGGLTQFLKSLRQRLSDELRQIADIRMENIELSLTEIGKLSIPEISRSGVYWRS